MGMGIGMELGWDWDVMGWDWDGIGLENFVNSTL
jgi:hypothetical protein